MSIGTLIVIGRDGGGGGGISISISMKVTKLRFREPAQFLGVLPSTFNEKKLRHILSGLNVNYFVFSSLR